MWHLHRVYTALKESPIMRRLLAVTLFFAAVPLLAQVQIQKIEFQSRIPAGLLRAQSMLREGGTYTDADLDIAMARLRKLPFVYSATYRLEGSRLVVEVIDARHLGLAIDTAVRWDSFTGSGSGGNSFFNGEAGADWYLPWNSVIKGSWALSSDSDLHSTIWRGEYAQYAILGTPAYLIARLDHSTGNGTSAPQAFLGYPLTLRQTIAVHGIRSHSSERHAQGLYGSGGFYSISTRNDSIAAEWMWDSTNDSLFANRGSLFTVEGGRTKGSNAFESKSGTFHTQSESKSSTTDWKGSAESFWPRGRGAFRGVLMATRQSGTTQSRGLPTSPFVSLPTRFEEELATIGYVYNFFDSVNQFRSSRNRLEVAVGFDRGSSTFGVHSDATTLKTFEIGYAVRNRVANLHFVLSYLTK